MPDNFTTVGSRMSAPGNIMQPIKEKITKMAIKAITIPFFYLVNNMFDKIENSKALFFKNLFRVPWKLVN